MTDAHYLQLDVFADRIGGGNPLGVVLDASDWSDAAMQAFAGWTNLVETTFLLAADRADRRATKLRIFTLTREDPVRRAIRASAARMPRSTSLAS